MKKGMKKRREKKARKKARKKGAKKGARREEKARGAKKRREEKARGAKIRLSLFNCIFLRTDFKYKYLKQLSEFQNLLVKH